MIDLNAEELMTLRQATKHPAFARGGRAAHISSVHRYVQRGTRGIKLEVIRAPGGMMTSTEAIVRFIERLTDPELSPTAPTPSQQSAGHRRAAAALAAEGL